MENQNNKPGCTITLSGPMFTLFCIFLILKLVNVIAWSWWWVFAPFWLPPVLFLGAFAIIKLFAFFLEGALDRTSHRRSNYYWNRDFNNGRK